MKTIRKPKLTEVAGIKQLLDTAAKEGSVLQRPVMELYENVRDFYTYVDENGIGGCCALHIDMVDLAEIRSLVVRSDLRSQRIGVRVLEACLDEARRLNIKRVYALTRNQAFFEKQGFVEADKRDLPHKVFNDCVRCPLFPDCDEIAMIKTLELPEPGDAPAVEPDALRTVPGTLGFLGFGNMGGAILRGLLSKGAVLPEQVRVFDVDAEKCDEAEALGVAVAPSPAGLARACDVLLLAVKPQTMAEALEQMKPGLSPKTLLISIAAGLSTGYFQTRLGAEYRVVRVMPNTPAMVNAGAAAIAPSANCTAVDASVARLIFESVGVVEQAPEAMMDTVTALSGSGPAYFFYLVECMTRGAAALGMDETQASLLAGQTLYGAGRLLKESGEPAPVLRARVTSKGGTTAAALASLDAAGFDRIVAAAVAAAAARSKELGQ